MFWVSAAFILAVPILVIYGVLSSKDRDRIPPVSALYFFGLAVLTALIVLVFGILQPKSLQVAPLLGWLIYRLIKQGLRLTKEHRVRASASYGLIKKAVTEQAHEDADVENILQNLPEGLQVSKRTNEVGFLRGGFRRFERIEIVGSGQTVLLDCIDGRVAGKRISVRLPTAPRK